MGQGGRPPLRVQPNFTSIKYLHTRALLFVAPLSDTFPHSQRMPHPVVSLSALALALALAVPARAAVIAELDAAALPAGAITTVPDKTGGGQWQWTASSPVTVGPVQGRPAFTFDGTQRLVSDFALPGTVPKQLPFTFEAWVLNPTLEKSETVAGIGPLKGGMGTEFNFATGANAGAFRSGFKATTPFASLPAANEWHHLAWSYADGKLSVYVDGELDSEKPLKVASPAPGKLFLGASAEHDFKGPKKGLTGAVARFRLHDTALSQAELRASAGLLTAFAPVPAAGSLTNRLSVTLRWSPGLPTATGYAVHAGTDRDAVTRGDSATALPVTGTSAGPLALRLGTPYFWRVSQRGPDGTLRPGPVWTFTADPGLASAPLPRPATSNTPASLTQLTWKPGAHATAQRIYFGNDEKRLAAATPAAELPAAAAVFAVPAPLQPGTRYYWRVDSDNGPQPPTRGMVWNFRTQDVALPNDVTFFVSSDTHYGRENNAATNRLVIDAMNQLPGLEMPKAVGGEPVRTPLGVILNGDLLDEGFDKETAPGLWAEFCRDYGLSGSDGRLCYPLYEGFGNHDGGPLKSITRAGIRERNPRRVGLTAVSPEGMHYSWDWGHLHCVQLNLFGGSGPADVKGVNPAEHNPEGALDFLRDDLAQHVGASGRPVIVFQHFAWAGGMADWWQPEAKDRFYDVVKPYRVACLINGHSHGAGFVPWKDLLTIHDGSTARGEGDTGDFMVVRVTDKELIVAQRKLGEWGITKRQPLQAPR